MGKHKNTGINHRSSERKNPEDEKTMLFSFVYSMPELDINGFAEEPSKKLAQ